MSFPKSGEEPWLALRTPGGCGQGARPGRHTTHQTGAPCRLERKEEGEGIMAEFALLDHAYAITMQYFINTGQAPHYTELARDLGLTMEAGKQLLHELIGSGIPAWLHPDTDYIASFAPFHNLPTQYRITIDGVQKWFAQ
jgi:hypothetical protein